MELVKQADPLLHCPSKFRWEQIKYKSTPVII